MAKPLATKTERIHLRLDFAAKQKLERAAAYSANRFPTSC